MNEVANDYIEKAFDELISVLGVSESIDHEELIVLIGSKKVKEAVKKIALYLGLPIEVNISYVPKGYRPNAHDGFQTTHIVKTDQHNRGINGITAQVSIPSNLPFYRSSQMINFPINVRLSENCAENPATLISIMAHELSHIVLYSMWHKEKENEFFTDLTAMILGYAKIMKTGRKIVKTTEALNTIHTETTTYGYLSDDNFEFAFQKIENLLNKQKSEKKKLIKKLKNFRKQLNKNKKLPVYFEKYLSHLDKNLDQKISPEDGQKIIIFHQFGYLDNFQSVAQKNQISLENYLKFVENLKNYNEPSIKMLEQYESQLRSTGEELTKQVTLLQDDINILSKNVSLFCRLKSRLTL